MTANQKLCTHCRCAIPQNVVRNAISYCSDECYIISWKIKMGVYEDVHNGVSTLNKLNRIAEIVTKEFFASRIANAESAVKQLKAKQNHKQVVAARERLYDLLEAEDRLREVVHSWQDYR